jgi:hypothetical protein
VNDWISEQFALNTVLKKEMNEPLAAKHSQEEKIKIIAQLRLLNTATANELADKMEKETE